MPTPSALFGAILFGAFGMAFFVHGKRTSRAVPLILGVALMGYPYLISDPIPLYLVGIALTFAAWRFRD